MIILTVGKVQTVHKIHVSKIKNRLSHCGSGVNKPNKYPCWFDPDVDSIPGLPPPVPVELPVSKLHELSHSVQAGMEEPVEEDEPDEVVGHLREGGGHVPGSRTPLPAPTCRAAPRRAAHRQLQEALDDA